MSKLILISGAALGSIRNLISRSARIWARDFRSENPGIFNKG
jgi:hypothetical protein